MRYDIDTNLSAALPVRDLDVDPLDGVLQLAALKGRDPTAERARVAKVEQLAHEVHLCGRSCKVTSRHVKSSHVMSSNALWCAVRRGRASVGKEAGGRGGGRHIECRSQGKHLQRSSECASIHLRAPAISV